MGAIADADDKFCYADHRLEARKNQVLPWGGEQRRDRRLPLPLLKLVRRQPVENYRLEHVEHDTSGRDKLLFAEPA